MVLGASDLCLWSLRSAAKREVGWAVLREALKPLSDLRPKDEAQLQMNDWLALAFSGVDVCQRGKKGWKAGGRGTG